MVGRGGRISKAHGGSGGSGRLAPPYEESPLSPGDSMAKHKVEDIRNIALVGHGAAGKTSLADTLLFQAKAVERRGSVDDGSSVSDYDEEEKAQKCSIDSTVLHLEHKGKYVHLIDTPGKPDFIGVALATLIPAPPAPAALSPHHA